MQVIMDGDLLPPFSSRAGQLKFFDDTRDLELAVDFQEFQSILENKIRVPPGAISLLEEARLTICQLPLREHYGRIVWRSEELCPIVAEFIVAQARGSFDNHHA